MRPSQIAPLKAFRDRQHMPRTASIGFKTTATVLAMSLVLSGCTGFMNTYLRSEKLEADVVIPAPKPGEMPAEEKFAGGMSSALDAANDQRMLYVTAVSRKSTTSDAIGAGLIALSAATIYKGITTNSDSAKRLLGLGGVAAGGLYAYNSYYSNKEADGAYLAGFRAISCVMLRARPVLLTQEEFGEFTFGMAALEEKLKTAGDYLDALAIQRGNELDEERAALIKAAQDPKKRANTDKSVTKPSAVLRFNKRHVDIRMEAAYDALRRARALLRNAQLLEQRIDTSGFNLRRRVDLIAAAVNEELSRIDKDIPKLDGLLAGIGQAGVNFKAVKPDATFTPSTDKSDAPFASSFTVLSELEASDQRSEPTDASKTAAAKTKDPLAPRSSISEASMIVLATKVNELYALQRTVAKTLLSYRALGKQVTQLDDCRFGSVPPLKVAPDKDEMTVEQGKQYQFVITGGRGIPKVWLTGAIAAADEKNKKTLETVVEQNQVVAKITIPTDTPKGVAYLVATDGQGQHHEEVALLIEKDPPKPDAKASAEEKKKKTNPKPPPGPQTQASVPAPAPALGGVATKSAGVN